MSILISSQGVRQNSIDCLRITEQTAILGSLLIGKGIENTSQIEAVLSDPLLSGHHHLRAGSAESFTVRSVLGALSELYCRGNLALVRESSTATKKLVKVLKEPFGKLRDENDGDMDLEFVIAPLDGPKSFMREGESGTISVIAGGVPGSFAPLEESKFFICAVNPDIKGPIREIRSVCHDSELFADIYSLIKELRRESPRSPQHFCLNAMRYGDPKFRKMHSVLSKIARVQKFSGSPVCAAMGALLPGFETDCFVGIVDKTQAALISVVAAAVNAGLFALPVVESVESAESGFNTTSDQFLGVEDFILDDDVFLAATGVSESHVVSGVRFGAHNLVTTDSVFVHARSQSLQFLKNRHALEAEPFRLLFENGAVEDFTYSDARNEIDKLLTKKPK